MNSLCCQGGHHPPDIPSHEMRCMLISTSAVNEIFTLLGLVTDPLYAYPAQSLHSQQAEVLLVYYQHTH